MDFLSFFGFKEDPFRLTPDPAYFYPSSSHDEGLSLLNYAIEQKEGFTIVIGNPGTGKTTLLNVLLQKWKPSAEIAMVLTPRLSPEEFLASVIEDLGISPDYKNKNEIIRALRDFMVRKASEDRRVVVIVDEAQNLPDETLEELRLLSNLETDKNKLLQTILIGQPELETRLTTDKFRQLNQRITTRIHLSNFKRDETADYINCRLIKAGSRGLNIHKDAKKLIYALSSGTPRLINMLISRALMSAYLEERNSILARDLRHAVKSLNHSDIRLKRTNKLIVASGLLLLMFLFGAGSYLYVQRINPRHAAQTQKSSKSVKEMPSVSIPKKTLPPKIISVKVNAANIREMPSLESEKIGWAESGRQFVVLSETLDEKETKWYQILYLGEKRWISGEVIDVFNPESINPKNASK